MWTFLIIVLLVVMALLFSMRGFASRNVNGGFSEKIAAILVLKAPIGVQEMRKKYIKTDNQPPHITLGYIDNFDGNEKDIFKQLIQCNPEPIVFEQWKHTKSFIGLIPKNVDEIERIIHPLKKYIDTGPRGGYHMSIAYRPESQELDPIAFKKAHELISTPLTCKIKEIRFTRYSKGEWTKFKSILFD